MNLDALFENVVSQNPEEISITAVELFSLK
jgi:hypothetical protein